MFDSHTDSLPAPLNRLPSSAIRLRTIDTQKNLFSQGDATRGLFFILAGSIELQRVTEAGHLVLVQKVNVGDTFAEASLFHSHYHCSAVATNSSEVIECSKQAVISHYREDPEFALAMCQRFAQQVQRARSKLEIISIRSADDRVFRALTEGMCKGSVKSMAHEIGLSPEVVYRSLNSLTKSGRVMKLGYGRYKAQ